LWRIENPKASLSATSSDNICSDSSTRCASTALACSLLPLILLTAVDSDLLKFQWVHVHQGLSHHNLELLTSLNKAYTAFMASRALKLSLPMAGSHNFHIFCNQYIFLILLHSVITLTTIQYYIFLRRLRSK
jgi:hypothetical protein